MSLIVIFVVLIFLHSLVSSRIEKTVITAPIVFTAAGLLACILQPLIQDGDGGKHYLLPIAEIGLVFLLFADAFRTDLWILKSFQNLPVRLLSIGMLLTIGLGLAAALGIFPDLTIWEAGILAAILAPTDAGLGQIIVNSKLVPLKIRQSLNVEAGLNDGLSVPFLLFFIAMASGGTPGQDASISRFIIEQLGYGAAIGIIIGLLGGRLLAKAERIGSSTHTWTQLGLFALPVLCILASEAAGASMFIAAFVGGMAARVGAGRDGACERAIEFTEEGGQLFNLSVFFLFGALVSSNFGLLGPRHVLYAIVSLTLVRMIPVAVSLIGTRLRWSTIVFMGWFGPRGLASIVLGLVYLEHQTGHSGESTIKLAVAATVLISIFAHGLSALPGMNIYAKKLTDLPQDASELTTDGAK